MIILSRWIFPLLFVELVDLICPQDRFQKLEQEVQCIALISLLRFCYQFVPFSVGRSSDEAIVLASRRVLLVLGSRRASPSTLWVEC